jgi:hypothetical protein
MHGREISYRSPGANCRNSAGPVEAVKRLDYKSCGSFKITMVLRPPRISAFHEGPEWLPGLPWPRTQARSRTRTRRLTESTDNGSEPVAKFHSENTASTKA